MIKKVYIAMDSISPDDKKRILIQILSNEILEEQTLIDENTNLYEVGLDSMATMQLLIRIEQRIGVQIPSSKLTKENLSTVSNLALII
jgi:acyl carrier protein